MKVGFGEQSGFGQDEAEVGQKAWWSPLPFRDWPAGTRVPLLFNVGCHALDLKAEVAVLCSLGRVYVGWSGCHQDRGSPSEFMC